MDHRKESDVDTRVSTSIAFYALLLAVIGLVIFVGVSVVVVMIFITSTKKAPLLKISCRPTDTFRLASMLKENMNADADPCEDFYEFACGGFMKKNVLSPNESRISTLYNFKNQLMFDLDALLSTKNKNDDPLFKVLTRSFYSSCMNLGRINERGIRPFLELLKTVGKFPALDQFWSEKDFDFQHTLIKLDELGLMPLFELHLQAFGKTRMIELSPPVLRKELQNNLLTYTLENYQRLKNCLLLLGANTEQAEIDAREIADFEIAIYHAITTEVEIQFGVPEYEQEMSLAQLQRRYQWMDWQHLLNARASHIKGNLSIHPDMHVFIERPDYFANLEILLHNTSRRVIANFIMSSTLKFTLNLGENFRAIDIKFEKTLSNVSLLYSPLELCLNEVYIHLPEALGRMYVDKHFIKESVADINAVITKVKDAFTELVSESSWLTSNDIKNVIQKITSMHYVVGHPKDILNDAHLNSYYSNIISKEMEFFEAKIAFLKNNVIEETLQFSNNTSHIKWFLSPAEANVFYEPRDNSINFPAAFLREPFYSSCFTSSMNFARLGFFTGHELTHAFDSRGIEVNEFGERGWLSEVANQTYSAQSRCFVDQFDSYNWDGNKIDGRLNLDENIADGVGITASYKAYRNLIEKQGFEDEKLPQLDLTQNQIFFLSFAQMWCSKYQEDLKVFYTKTEVHAPDYIRSFGPLRNMDEFAKVYNCKRNFSMAPEKKCVIW